MNIESMYFSYIDELRKDWNIRIDDFCYSICSPRQYWRYLNGSNICPQDKFSKFIFRLKLSTHEFYNSFYSKELMEYDNIISMYLSLSEDDLLEARNIYMKLSKINFSSNETKNLFGFISLLLRIKSDNKNIAYSISLLKQYVNYDFIMSKKQFGFIDVSALYHIAHLERNINKYEAAEILYDLIVEGDSLYYSSYTRYLFPSVYLKLAKLYGSKKDYSKSLYISKVGIKYSLKIYDNSALPSLYYSTALSEYKLGLRDTFENSLVKCLMICKSTNRNDLFATFMNLIEINFGITRNIIEGLIIKEMK